MKRKTIRSIILGVSILVFSIITAVLNIKLVFDSTSAQTSKIGSIQMENISAELQTTFDNAGTLVSDVAHEVELSIMNGATKDDLTSYFEKQKQAMTQDGQCINVYMATPDYYIIPDFKAEPDFVATERSWYTGAIANPNKVYITQPYLDLASTPQRVCFTVSRVLSDKKTVICLDYNLDQVQSYIKEMGKDGTALIVDKDGVIAGYSDSNLLGTKISETLPEFQDILDLEKNNQNRVVLTRKMNGRTQTIFCSKTANDWYLILAVESVQLYSSSYQQIIWITVVNGLLIIGILVLYWFSRKKEVKAEEALQIRKEFLDKITSDLSGPIQKIVNFCAPEMVRDYDTKKESYDHIRESAIQMGDIVDSLSTLASEPAEEKKVIAKKTVSLPNINKRIRRAVITVIFAAMCISVTLVAVSNVKLGNERMHEEADYYENELSSWVNEQKSVLGMFCNMISAKPEILDDYTSCKEYLNDITVKYSDISVTYMTNPSAPYPVIMNTGWMPPENWKVEERPWYIDTLASPEGWNISDPYFDSNSGNYCVTFSQIVRDKNGKFLGIFGIDFYMEKLSAILEESYTDKGYAVLIDMNGNIINHPNAFYQMSIENTKSIFDTEAKDCYTNNMEIHNFNDYDGNLKSAISKKNTASGFTVMIVKDWWSMFGQIILYSALFILMFGGCIAAVYYLISKLMIWQQQVNDQLQEAVEKATSAGKAKSRFLAQMSHEIRTPINAVLGMNELIMRECTDTTIREYSNDIQSAGRTLLSLINSILDFSKIEDGKMEIVPVNYDTSSLINDLVNMTAERSRMKNLELKLEIDETIPSALFGDDVRLRQVIVNLLTNAIKYTEQGSVTLTMKVQESTDGVAKLYVSVSDTGIGIREEDKDKLCLSFSRLDQERNHAIEGTGLGLSIVTKLLTMMKSELQIESEYGKGSNFYFVIEQGIVNREPIGDYTSRRNAAQDSENDKLTLYAPNADILAVDDNEMNLKVVRGLLRKNGIVPDVAGSGINCLDMVKNKHYDIILLDHMMPVMDGIETRKQLTEKNLIDSTTKVIVLTANAIVGAKEMYLEAGFDDYLSKPIDATKLEQKLMEYLPKEKVKTQADAEKPVAPAAPEAATPEAEEVKKESSLIDTSIGITYCAGDKDMYIEVAEAYLEEADSNIEKLDTFYDARDWKNYSIIAHAVKSASKTIGAMSLGDIAYTHEMAGKAGDGDAVDATYTDFLTLYGQVLAELAEIIEKMKNE